MAQCRHTLLDCFQAASYLHVDDVVCVSVSSAGVVHANRLMSLISDALEAVGFTVPEDSRHSSEDIDKVIGYSIWSSLGRFTVDTKKWVIIREAFREQASAKWVSADILRALVGYWLFAAL